MPTLRQILSIVMITFFLVSCSGLGVQFTPPEPVTLVFAYSGRESDYQGLVAQFQEKYPHITVQLKPVNPGRSGNTSVLLSQFSQADVVRANIAFLDPSQADEIVSLDEFLAIDKSFNKDDFYPGLLEAAQVEQKQMALPAGVDPMVMFYENTRFKIAGVTPPGPDYTLDEFLTAAAAVNNQEEPSTGDSYAAGFCTSPSSSDPLVFVYLFGGKMFDRIDRPTRPTLNDPANIEAVEWYTRLWTEYKITPPAFAGANPTYEYLNKTWCGFWMNLYDTALFFGANTTDMRMLPLPRARAPFSYALWDGYFLTRFSTHPQEAWSLMSFLVNHQEASLRQIPPLRSLVNDAAFAQRVSPDALVVARGLPAETYFFNLTELSTGGRQFRVMDIFGQAVDQVVRGNVDAKTALDKAQEAAEKVFTP